MDNRNHLSRVMSFGISDLALDCVMGYIEDPYDRGAISLVCKKWNRIDCLTRKHVTIAICYSTSPQRLRERFPRLESLKLKGKPRAAMFFNLIPEDWGGYAGPWVNEIASDFFCLKSLHLRRMIVRDADIDVLARARGHMLQVLKLDKCSGFSTDGLSMIAASCRCLRILFLEESSVIEKDGGWLHQVAVNGSLLEVLNFYMTDLKSSWKDLELIAKNCRSIVSLKISECDVSDLVGFFRIATSLEEFGGGSFDGQAGEDSKYNKVAFPPRLCRLGLNFMGSNEMHIVFPVAAALKKLDLQYTFLSTEDHCQLIQRCPNIEVLEVRDVIGDRGLEIVGQTCKRLRRLRIERGEDEQGLEDEQGMVSHRGLSAIAHGCPELEYLAVYVSDITNAALETMGTYSKNLCDFRLVLLEREERITELPLDNGVRGNLLARKMKKIDDEMEKNSCLLKEIQENPTELNAIVAKKRKDFTGEFFHYLNVLSDTYDGPEDRDAMARLGAKCLSAVRVYDSTMEHLDSLEVAQTKFDDILNSSSIEASFEKINLLAKVKELDSSLILLINRAWAATKESTTLKNEVKDIMYQIYRETQKALRNMAPPEIKLIQYLLNIADPEERFAALATAFSPGDEHQVKDVNALYSTPKELHKWIKMMLDAYHLNKEETDLMEARQMSDPILIHRLLILKETIEVEYMKQYSMSDEKVSEQEQEAGD